MAAAEVQPAALYDIELSLPSDNGLLRPALTQSLEFDKVRDNTDCAIQRAKAHTATKISLRLQLRTRRGDLAARDILHDVSGACFPGMLMAIMGATGSGKTSLMNILARRLVLTKGLRVSGVVLLNGSPRPRNWKSHYVEQHDLLFSELTVHETLHFAAQLRLPASATSEERAARVDAVVATLGLQAVLHSRVGGDLVRGISGGERKRLALGNDLIVDPPLLFLDEPTSGLDAFNAQSVMSSLKLLASTGRSVVACLHQPRSGITALFDSLLLLSEGRCMYSGPALEALPFFQRCSFRSPPHTNPSDFYLDVISVSLRSNEAEAASRARVALLADACASEQPALLQALRAMTPKASGRGVTEGVSVRILDATVVEALADGPKGDNPRAAGPVMEMDVRHQNATLLHTLRRRQLEWRALSGRAGKLALRQKLENTLNLVRTIIFSTLLGLIWLNVGRKQSGTPADLRNLGGLLFFSIVNHSFSGVFSVVYVFASECRQILRERVAGMYGVSPYFVSRLAVELPRNALWTLLHSVLIYWIVGLRANASAFFIFVAIHLLVEINAEALTMWVSAFTRSEKMASALAPIPLVLSILFGGFFISASAIPVFLRWIRYLAFMRWSYVALVRNEMNGRVFDCPAVAASQRTFNPAVTGGACIPDGDAAVELLTPNAQLGLTACAWVLVGMACTCWFGTYWVLRYNKPRYDTSV